MIGEGNVSVTDGEGCDIGSILRVIASESLYVVILSAIASHADSSIVQRF